MLSNFSLLRKFEPTVSKTEINLRKGLLNDYFYNVHEHMYRDDISILSENDFESFDSLLDYRLNQDNFKLVRLYGDDSGYIFEGIARAYSWRDDIRRKKNILYVPNVLNDVDSSFFNKNVIIANLSADVNVYDDRVIEFLASIILIGDCYCSLTHSLFKSISNGNKFLSLLRSYMFLSDESIRNSSNLSESEIKAIDELKEEAFRPRPYFVISLNRLPHVSCNNILIALYDKLRSQNRKYLEMNAEYINEMGIGVLRDKYGNLKRNFMFSLRNVDNPTKLTQLFGE